MGIVNEAMRANYELGHLPNQLKAPSSFNNSQMMKQLRNEFGQVGGMYLKNHPWSYYDWHIDMGRKCSLNWLIKTTDTAQTLYRERLEPDRKTSIIYNIYPVEYCLYKPTLMDVTSEHCVINPSPDERIIFSLSLNVEFDVVKDFLCSIKTI
jgi:hypothetical protein